jgi:hypothetical protein
METQLEKKFVQEKIILPIGDTPLLLTTKPPILQSPDDASATATMLTSMIACTSPGTAMSNSNQAFNNQTSNLQLALIKHWDDILRLRWAGTDSGKHTIPPKMLTKV